ncbi:tRNA 2-thiouridine(34) synthase MnmA, partial [Candidatus Saccharibacteria bacterium]|nr:tRNA 2-thiouridine(34) synthase MnmA [Candidatus Saccharibacteria bacterium]
DFKVYDFEKEYKQKVVDYMLAEFKAGRTPNPDIMCNQEVKFKLFYDIAREEGADFIATGHYAQTDDTQLLRAADDNKDQTYFLYRISQDALAHTIFPIGHLKKPEVKQLAEKFNLHVAHKKESMGVCFVGEVGMKNFIKEYIETTPGEIQDADTHETLGYHDGAILYTVGQRHGLNIGGGLPYYVTGKDIKKNIVYVSKNLNHQDLWTTELELEDIIWRGSMNQFFSDRVGSAHRHGRAALNLALPRSGCPAKNSSIELLVRLRHRAPLIPATLTGTKLTFTQPIKRPAPGQSAVFYHGQTCLGGGIIK